MNAKQLTTLSLLLVTVFGAVHAEGPMPESQWTAEIGKSRADVIAERDAAIRDGFIAGMHGEDSGASYLARTRTRSYLARAQVQAEVLAARRSGELHALHGEDSGSFHMAAQHRPQGGEDPRVAQRTR